jgi:integrase
MPRKYQDGALEVRRDVKRPYYFVRTTIPIVTEQGRRSRRVARNLGFVDEINVKQAKKLRAELLETVNRGRMLTSSQIQFREICKRYMAVELPRLGAGTQARYRSQIDTHILPFWGEARLCDIDPCGIEAWLQQKETCGLGWWSREGLRGVISAIFETARRWKLWEGDNPAKGVRLGKKKTVRDKRLLTVEELQRIFAALRTRDDRLYFIVLVMFGLGLRVGETLGLRWRDIDLDAGTLHVRRRWYRGDLSEDGETKTDTSLRVVQLGPLVGEFKQRRAEVSQEQFVFLGDDGVNPPDDRDLLRYELRPLLKRLKLYYPGFGWHTFRRQNVTWRQQVGGATPLEAMRAAGHSSVDMTLLYTLTDVARERSQVQAMFDKLMEVPEGPLQ